MAYTDEGMRAKLSALNETQESIVQVAQWTMFHKRHADKSAAVWLQKVKDSGASKRLNLIYLANEVIQQSKARKKEDFLIAFSPIIADATATAYKGATNEVQNKLRRVVEVWKQRQIFDPSIQEAVEARLNEIDKSRGSGKKSLLGANPFSNTNASAAPPELQPLVPLQGAVTKASLAITNHVSTYPVEYSKNMDPDASLPSAPVYAARLSALLKSLANASSAVSDGIKARKDLLGELEKLVDKNRTALAEDETRQQDLQAKTNEVETKKRDVEDEILRGLPAESTTPSDGGKPDASNGHISNADDDDSARPQIEELTPPPIESFTPEQSPRQLASSALGDVPASDMVNLPMTRPFEGSPAEEMFKRRRLDDTSDLVQGDAMADLDDDVAELLRAEGGG